MKNPTESNSTTDELPSFLDATTNDALDGTTVTTDPSAEAESTDYDGDVPPAVEPDAAPAAAAPTRATTPHARTATAPRGGGTAAALGVAALAGAAALAFAPLPAATVDACARAGLTPATLLMVAAVSLVSGAGRRRLGELQTRIDQVGGEAAEATERLHEGVQFLVEAQHANNERPPAAGEELQHVLVALQRQDEKINNLTKAIKMYGKPLMEISGQGTELAGVLSQTRTAVEAAADTAQKAFARLESQLRGNTAHKEIADLSDIVLKVATTLETMQKKGHGSVSLEPLQQQLGRVEVNLAALAQRVEDNELRKSLLRLEDATQKARDDMQQLLRGENLQKATHHLSETVDKATGKLARGLDQMRDGQLGALETSLREVQREVTGVATAVAQIQAALRSGAGRATATASLAATPAATGAPAPAAVAPPAAERPADTKTPAPAADSAGNAGYQTGTRSTNGKNVLGAIAKLKQMKT